LPPPDESWAASAQRQTALERLLNEYQREFGSISREAQFVLGRLVDEYADLVAAMRGDEPW
jgi:hypothetical protein